VFSGVSKFVGKFSKPKTRAFQMENFKLKFSISTHVVQQLPVVCGFLNNILNLLQDEQRQQQQQQHS